MTFEPLSSARRNVNYPCLTIMYVCPAPGILFLGGGGGSAHSLTFHLAIIKIKITQARPQCFFFIVTLPYMKPALVIQLSQLF